MGYSYFNGKKTVAGTAALLHKIKSDGGLEEHYKKLIDDFVVCAIERGNKDLKLSNFKRVK